MSKIFFIGDTHIGDSTIVKLEHRPFANVEEQTSRFVELWNKTVAPNDTVYVLGDFSIDNPSAFHIEQINKLNGHKILVRGNHDTLPDEVYINKFGFDKVYDHPILLNDFWILLHEPKYVNENFPYANIFAHVHNNPMYRTHSCRHYCVSVERINYSPISFDDIKSAILDDDKLRHA